MQRLNIFAKEKSFLLFKSPLLPLWQFNDSSLLNISDLRNTWTDQYVSFFFIEIKSDEQIQRRQQLSFLSAVRLMIHLVHHFVIRILNASLNSLF